MAATRVQTKGNGTTGASSYTIVFDSNVTAGSVILLSVFATNSATIAVSDSQTNTWTAVDKQTIGGQDGELWYAYNVAGGATTITVAHGLVTSGNAIAREYAGLTITDPLDKHIDAGGTAGTASSGDTATTIQDNELVVGGGTSATNPGVGTGFTNYTEQLTAGTTVYAMLQDKDQTTAAVQSTTFTGTGSNWTASVATFKEASAVVNTGFFGML